MRIADIPGTLEAELRVRGKQAQDGTFSRVVASDLMSDVLTVDDDDFVLVTSLASDQVARTADIVGASAVILTGGRKPQPGLVKLAEESGLTLFTTKATTFEVCYRLGRGLSAENRMP